jgi:hypothetical protein
MDAYSTHAYTSPSPCARTNQAYLNQVVWPTFEEGTDRSGYAAGLLRLRSLLDARGGPRGQAMPIAQTEYEPPQYYRDAAYAPGALADILTAIASAVHQGQAKLAMTVFMDVHRDDQTLNGGHGDSLILYNGSFVGSVRYYALRDMVLPFLRTYKDQVAFTDPAESGVGLTPPSGADNPVPRIYLGAGLNADRTKLGVLVANLDLTSSQSFTLDLGTTAAGPITGKQLLQTQPIGSAIPSLAPFGSGLSSLALTLAAGEARYLEIPLPAGGSSLEMAPETAQLMSESIATSLATIG